MHIIEMNYFRYNYSYKSAPEPQRVLQAFLNHSVMSKDVSPF